MKKFFFVFFAFVFISCADGIKGSWEDDGYTSSTTNSVSSTTSEATSNTESTSNTGNSSDNSATEIDSEDPFAGTIWVSNEAIASLSFTVEFSTSKTVSYYANAAGTTQTFVKDYPYTVKTDFAGVSGQYAAQVGSNYFTIPSKNATSTTFAGNTFVKQ